MGASTRHKPLVLKGARQVGRTWALREFGAKSFDNVAYVSLENIAPGIPSEYAQLFERTHDPRRIMRNLGLALGCDIEPGRTLLVLDEIQDCPAALGALKCFAEELPEQHVACAGSLLGVALARDDGSFPVGKVTFRQMGPMSFSEFLRATGGSGLDGFCSEISGPEPLPGAFVSGMQDPRTRDLRRTGMEVWGRLILYNACSLGARGALARRLRGARRRRARDLTTAFKAMLRMIRGRR